jgi:hypothetical protein
MVINAIEIIPLVGVLSHPLKGYIQYLARGGNR